MKRPLFSCSSPHPVRVLSLVFLCAAIASSSSAFAQDPRDNDIFGGDPTAPSEAVPAATPDPTAPLEGKLTRISESALADTLQVGGRIEIRASTGQQEQQNFGDASLGQLKQGDVFLDARPNPDLRAFFRFRLSQQDPAAGSGDPNSDAANNATACADCVRAQIDELWFKWDVAKTAYVTAGKQHLKWGSGRVWNPTDFTALETRDPFALTDRRLGQTLLKVHLPVEKTSDNFYAIAQFDDAARNSDVGGALRAEITFLGSGELALSAATRKGAPVRLGADVSSALGPVDVHAEAAFSTRQKRTFYEGDLDPAKGAFPRSVQKEKAWFNQAVGGLEWSWKYSDEDSLTLGGEYFYNQLGYSDRDLELYALLSGQASSLYSGKQYAAAYARVPSPGAWNDVSFYLTGIENLSDKTASARLTGAYVLFKEASLEAFVNRCFGDYGELCFRVPETYRAAARSAPLPDATRQRLVGLPSRRTKVTAGVGISAAF